MSGQEMNVFIGHIAHSTWEDPLVILPRAAIGVRNDKIVFLGKSNQLEELLAKHHFIGANIIRLKESEFIIPGFVDTHIHASQYTNAGRGLDLPLLQWLEKYTFPTEASLSNLQVAELAYTANVKRVLKNGTTTACYFATIDTDSTLELCRIIGDLGQRAMVGKVCMNQNSPKYYTESTQNSLKETERYINAVRALKNPLVNPVVTPRFAVSCDEELLRKLGQLAHKYDTHIQSHVSENLAECEWIKKLFPDCQSYTDVYHKTGLLHQKTVLAHGVHLKDSELRLFRETGAAISHCPNSNISICSGLCDVRRILENGVKVGLGTDVSGGFHPSILNAIRMATQTSNIISLNKDPSYRRIDYKEAFRLATLGGSQALGLEEVIGNIEIGKSFDAMRIDVECTDSPVDIFDSDTLDDVFQKFIYLGDDRNIQDVYIAGCLVCSRTDHKSAQFTHSDRISNHSNGFYPNSGEMSNHGDCLYTISEGTSSHSDALSSSSDEKNGQSG